MEATQDVVSAFISKAQRGQKREQAAAERANWEEEAWTGKM